MIIAVATNKGGVGKSTLAVHLAAWLSERGHRVALADCDTQHSSSEWCKEALPDVTTVRLANAEEIIEQLPELGSKFDYVVADGPGSNTEISRTLLTIAHLALVPCKASMLEVLALEQATRFIRHANVVRPGALLKAVIVLSMIDQRYRLTEDMRKAASALQLPLAATPLTLRQVYADAPGQQTVVGRMGARANKAAKEVDRLCRELLPQAAVRNAKKSKKSKAKPTASATLRRVAR